MGNVSLPDPRRDEDEPEEYVVLSTDFHQCSVLTENVWVCDECGETFPREQNGDYPEQAIIEGKCEP